MRNVRLKFLQRILLFVSLLGALIVLNLIWVIPTIRATYTSASVLALETVERARADVEFSLETIQRDFMHASEEIALDPKREKIVAELLLKQNPIIKSVGVAGNDGKETFLVDRIDFIAPADLHDYSAQSYFAAARGGRSAFGDVFISPASEPHIMLALPIMRAGTASGVLVGEINIRDLVSAIHTPETEQGHVYVVDKNGFQIIHPDLTETLRRPNFMARPIINRVVTQRVLANGLASDDAYVNEQGENTFTVGMPVAGADLSIFFETPRRLALAGIRQVIVFAAITVLLGSLALFMIMRASSRLQDFNARLNELLQENYEVGKMMVRRDLELTRANARLEELDQIKSEFVSIAAHQLRTPLTGIRWSYQAILDGETGSLNPEQRRLLESGLGATLRMVELVNDLLNVARIEEGKFGIRLVRQPIAPLITRLVERYAELAQRKGVIFSYTPAAGPSPDILLDEEKITIVLDNVLDNALKYTEPGGKIFLRIAVQEKCLLMEVADTGIGIPKSQLHRVFTKFFRADNALRFHTAGTGLGLYVVKNIVEKHGGAIEIASNIGKGTVFRITLPVV